jgi:hypothetical protein
LRTIDGGPFQAYRRILGDHELGDFRLTVQSVPPDALGGPARLRLSIDRARAGLLGAWSHGEVARRVLEDAIARAAARAVDEGTGPSAASAPGSGRIWIEPPGPELADRTSARVGDERLDVSLAFDLPAAARRVRGHQAEAILFEHLPRVGMAALLFPLRRVHELKPQIAIRARERAAAAALAGRGLVALLPLASLSGRIVEPGGLTTIETEHGATIGLAVPTGITLFVTTGVSGAGAWLRDLVAEPGIVPGREAILAGPVATPSAAHRSLGPLDVSAFLRACPEVPVPEAYASEHAPASLAVAASLVTAIEAGARIIVLDEDEIPAGAFGGEGRMQPIVGGPPPLVPIMERLSDLRDRWGVSFLIAARATGSLGDSADTVFILRADRVEDASELVRRSTRTTTVRSPGNAPTLAAGPAPREMRVVTDAAPGRLKVAAWGRRGVRVGDDLVDLRDMMLVREAARLRAIAALLKRAASLASTWRPVEEVLDALEAAAGRQELDRLEEPGLVDLERPTRLEIASALVRWKRAAFRVAAGKVRATAEDPS